MARIDELKKQNPKFDQSLIDIIRLMVPNQSSKYTEMLLNLIKGNPLKHKSDHILELRQELISHYKIPAENIPKDNLSVNILWNILETFITSTDSATFVRFCELNEQKLIDNTDITTYKTFEQVSNAVQLSELRLLSKELEKQIYKVYEDAEWLVLRPLTIEASSKYGSGTKWCTTMQNDNYYERYCRSGILFYNINKKTGNKVACFKNLDPDGAIEFSFWDVKDIRIDSIESGLPNYILKVILNEVKTNPITNNRIAGRSDYKGSSKSKALFDPETFAPLQEAINNIGHTSDIEDAIRTGTIATWETASQITTPLTLSNAAMGITTGLDPITMGTANTTVFTTSSNNNTFGYSIHENMARSMAITNACYDDALSPQQQSDDLPFSLNNNYDGVR